MILAGNPAELGELLKNVFMKNCCLLFTMMLAFFVLPNGLTAQTKANCDVTKCTKTQLKACAKTAVKTENSKIEGLVKLTSNEGETLTKTKKNCNPSNCTPAQMNACKAKGSKTAQAGKTQSGGLVKLTSNAETTQKSCNPFLKNCCKKSAKTGTAAKAKLVKAEIVPATNDLK